MKNLSSSLPSIALSPSPQFSGLWRVKAKAGLALIVLHLSFITLPTFITPLPAQPTIEWQKSFGSSYFDETYCIQQTSDDGYIILGIVVESDGDVFGAHGGDDFWVVKLSSTGSIQWKKAYGGSNNDWPYFIQQTSDGGYIMSGFTESNNWDVSGNHGDKDAWVVKLNSTGTIQWQKCYGGSKWESAHSIKQTTDGGYIFTGIAQSTDGDVSGVNGDLDYWVVKLSESGSIQWQKALGGSTEDIAYDVQQTSDGGYLVAGKASSDDGDVVGNHGSGDYWLVKLSMNGDIEWKKALGGNSFDAADEVWQTSDGGYVVVGYTHFHSNPIGDVTGHHGGFYDVWVAKVSSIGDLQWQKALGGSNRDYGRSVQQTADGGYIVAGSTESNDGDVSGLYGYMDAWLVKLSSIGEVLWQKPLGGSSDDAFFSVQQTSDGGYIAGGYNWSTDGDATTCNGYNDFWVVKLSPESSPTTEAQAQPLEIYPNPTSSTISLQIPGEEPTLTVCIIDLLGRVNKQGNISSRLSNHGGQASEVDVSALPSGLYLVTATTPNGKVYAGKLYKE